MKKESMLMLQELCCEPQLAGRVEEKLDVSAPPVAIGSLSVSAAWGGKKLGHTGVWTTSTLRLDSPVWSDCTAL